MSRLIKKNLTIINGEFDLSYPLSRFDDVKEVEGELFIGYHKPIHTLYFDIHTPQEEGILQVEKWDGEEWMVVDRLDETNNLSVSSHIFMEEVGEIRHVLFNRDLFWIKISMVGGEINCSLRYVNLVFNTEDDLLTADPNIKNYYPVDEDGRDVKTLLLSLMNARDSIIAEINRFGKKKYVNGGTTTDLFNQFDFFNIAEVKTASIYKALHHIYENHSDSNDDKMLQLAQLNYARYLDAMSVFKNGYILDLDVMDSGENNQENKIAQNNVIVFGRFRK